MLTEFNGIEQTHESNNFLEFPLNLYGYPIIPDMCSANTHPVCTLVSVKVRYPPRTKVRYLLCLGAQDNASKQLGCPKHKFKCLNALTT